MAEFKTPDFLQGHSEEEIYQKMRAMLPADIDSSEGSHVWNFLRPAAMVAAELCEAVLPQVIMTIFPEWAAGEYLEAHAVTRGLTRKEATAASGYVSFIFSVPAWDNCIPAGTKINNGVAEYVTTKTVPDTFDPYSQILETRAPVVCTTPGTEGNAASGTTWYLSEQTPEGIHDIYNASPITGGTDDESDDSLRERILAYDRNRGSSYVGNAADYRRWALEVDGVGSVSVESGTDGDVILRLTGTDGAPASTSLCGEVYQHIMRLDDPYARLAPVNADLTVRPADAVCVYVEATVILTGDGTRSGDAILASVLEAFCAELKAYLLEASQEGVVRIARVGSILLAHDSVTDYAYLRIGTEEDELVNDNIVLEGDVVAVTDRSYITLEPGAELT